MYTAPCAAWHTPVFLLNSRLSRLSATLQSDRREAGYLEGHPFFRSYGIIMPSSLTTFHSFTLGYSPCPPVSVYGTDVCSIPEQSFSCQQTLRDSSLGCPALSYSSLGCPTLLNGQSTRPLALRFWVPLSLLTHCRRGRNFDRLSIDYAFGASP